MHHSTAIIAEAATPIDSPDEVVWSGRSWHARNRKNGYSLEQHGRDIVAVRRRFTPHSTRFGSPAEAEALARVSTSA
jgi:hypothetical protein